MTNNEKLINPNAEKILHTAWQLFQQKGFRGVSMDELCQHCGITKPTLYYYFDNKEDLFTRVLLHKLENLGVMIKQPGDLQESLNRIAFAILENFQDEYTGLVHDREHIQQQKNQELVHDAFHEELFEPINNLMKSGIQEGLLTREDPHTLTLIFLGMINNFIGKSAEIKKDNATIAKILTQYFLKGALNRE